MNFRRADRSACFRIHGRNRYVLYAVVVTQLSQYVVNVRLYAVGSYAFIRHSRQLYQFALATYTRMCPIHVLNTFQ